MDSLSKFKYITRITLMIRIAAIFVFAAILLNALH